MNNWNHWSESTSFVPLVSAYLAQRAQRRIRSLVDRNKEGIATTERIIMAPSSSNKDLETLKKDAILAFLLSQYEPSHKERLDGMSRQALMKELKEWVSVLFLIWTLPHFNFSTAQGKSPCTRQKENTCSGSANAWRTVVRHGQDLSTIVGDPFAKECWLCPSRFSRGR